MSAALAADTKANDALCTKWSPITRSWANCATRVEIQRTEVKATRVRTGNLTTKRIIVFGAGPLPRDRPTSWRIELVSGVGCKRVAVGIQSGPLDCSDRIDITGGVFWSRDARGSMYSWTLEEDIELHQHMPMFQAGDVCHFTFDPSKKQLSLRFDRLPNRHFPSVLRSREELPPFFIALILFEPCICRLERE
mgnify:CR=1 FL=1